MLGPLKCEGGCFFRYILLANPPGFGVRQPPGAFVRHGRQRISVLSKAVEDYRTPAGAGLRDYPNGLLVRRVLECTGPGVFTSAFVYGN